jgi:hypothetical protein
VRPSQNFDPLGQVAVTSHHPQLVRIGADHVCQHVRITGIALRAGHGAAFAIPTVAACESLECPSLDLLAELDPTIDVRRDERFVDDGDTLTASGWLRGRAAIAHLVV